MTMVLIGIDDTDNASSPGTGRLARRLADELAQRGAELRGITRHQFLKDARIPYTSHNSGACLAIQWPGAMDDLGFILEHIGQWCADGSDPGVCISPAEQVPRAVMDWGWAAKRRVLTMDQAISVAAASHVHLRALGGTGQGIIGALGSVGLRADGNEGRFLDLPGLRELGDYTKLEELAGLGISIEHRGSRAPDGARYQTFGWVRPRLFQGRAVWPVRWSEEHHAWIPVDRKKQRPPN